MRDKTGSTAESAARRQHVGMVKGNKREPRSRIIRRCRGENERRREKREKQEILDEGPFEECKATKVLHFSTGRSDYAGNT